MKKFVLVSLFLALISGNALAECQMTFASDNTHLEIMNFETGRATISPECRAKIEKKLQEVDTDSLVKIGLTGLASNSGDAGMNANLSKERVTTVKGIIRGMAKFAGVPIAVTRAGESEANAEVPDMPNDNDGGYRAVWVEFFYPETNDKYAEIVSLREACKDVTAGDANKKTNGLFTEYIAHLREGHSSSGFEQSKIDAVADIAAEHCVEGLKSFCADVADAKWDDTEKKCKCNQDGYVALYDEKKCISQQTLADTSASRAEIDKISKRIDAIKSQNSDSFKVTVWRDAQGKFNTSRLISDSVAGVVLGTTGALVTSKLVKKSQIKNGFEDIQCTVGGQKVADWGDEFRVGIQ